MDTGALTFSMEGLPRGKGSVRATVHGKFATVYQDSKTRAYEKSVAVIARAAMGARTPFQGPVSACFRFRLPIPKSASKRVREAMAAGEMAPTIKPDLSNAQKAVEDGMNTIVYRDDAQIVRCLSTKVYSDNPGVDVHIEPLGAEATP